MMVQWGALFNSAEQPGHQQYLKKSKVTEWKKKDTKRYISSGKTETDKGTCTIKESEKWKREMSQIKGWKIFK